MRLALALALAALAGCTAPQDAGSVMPAPGSAIVDELGAVAGDATSARDALVIPVRATPEGAIAAAWWTIPEELLVEGDAGPELRVMAAPLGADGAEVALERWLLVAFAEEDDGLSVHGFAFGVPVSAKRGAEEQVTERSVAPFPFGMAEVSEGQRIALVFAAVSSQPVDVALVLAPLQGGASAPSSRDGFLDALGDAPRIALPATQVAAPHVFSMLNHMTAATGEQTISSGTAKVEHRTTGLGSLGMREVRVSNEFASRGYTFAFAAYSNDAGVGEWTSAFDMHGERREGSGEVRNVAGTALEDVPLAAAAGEGEGPATGELRAQVTSAAGSDALTYVSIDLGATLTELLGVGAAPVEPGDVTMAARAASLMFPRG